MILLCWARDLAPIARTNSVAEKPASELSVQAAQSMVRLGGHVPMLGTGSTRRKVWARGGLDFVAPARLVGLPARPWVSPAERDRDVSLQEAMQGLMDATTGKASERTLHFDATTAHEEVVEILAGAVFALLLDGRAQDAELQSSNRLSHTSICHSNLPCLVDQRTPSCVPTVASTGRRKGARA